MLSKLHHVGIAVRDADEALGFYRDALGLEVSVDRVMESEGVRGVLLPVGESEIELLEPTHSGSGIAKFIDSRGPGLHHLCFETDNCAEELRTVAERGVVLIDREPRQGLAGMIGFLHPKSNHGVLIELATPPRHSHGVQGGAGVVRNIREVGIVVRDRQAAEATYLRNFGLIRDRVRADTSHSLGTQASYMTIGGSDLALLESISETGVVARFAQERGEGMCMVTLEADDLSAAVERLFSLGIECGESALMGGMFPSTQKTFGVNLRLVGRGTSSSICIEEKTE